MYFNPIKQDELCFQSSTPFYVLLAAGPIDEETNTIRRHNLETASKEAVDFSKLTYNDKDLRPIL